MELRGNGSIELVVGQVPTHRVVDFINCWVIRQNNRLTEWSTRKAGLVEWEWFR